LSSFPLSTEHYRPFGGGYDYEALYADRRTTASLDPIREGLKNYVSRPKEQVASAILKTVALFDVQAILRRPLSGWVGIGSAVVNAILSIFQIGVILLGVLLVFRMHSNPFPYLPHLITVQYLQALFLWSEPRYLMPFYAFLVPITLAWYANRWKSFAQRHKTVTTATRAPFP
jgi:hypothetical protein